MRKVFSVALMAAMLCLVGITKEAKATVTFDLVWTSCTGVGCGVTGSNNIVALGGNTLILSILLTTDQTLGAHGVSLNFDTDLENELNLFLPAGGQEWAGTTFGMGTAVSNYAPINSGVGGPPAVESTLVGAGRISTFDSGVLTGPLFLPVAPLGTYIIGTARFVVDHFQLDAGGGDVFVGLFNTGVDDVLNNANLVIPPGSLIFGNASVNGIIPEPGTASLLGLGLVGLVLAGRRSRRS